MHRSLFQACHNRCIWLSLLLASFAAGATQLSLSVADIAAPDFSARGIALILPEDGSADLRIAELHVQQRSLRNVRIRCASFALSTASMSCHGGSLDQLAGTIVEFDYRFDTGNWQASAALHNVSARQFSALLPAIVPLFTQGELSGTLRLSGLVSGVAAMAADMRLSDVGFSDASGLHAAEKLRGAVKFSATRKAALWAWQGDIVWESGELFWQPLYLRGGHKVSASGIFDGESLKIEQAAVELPEAGRVQFAALWDTKQGVLAECTARGDNLALEKLFADYARPFLDKGALAESNLYGHADVDWQYRDGKTQALHLALRDAGIADAERRFALLGVNSVID